VTDEQLVLYLDAAQDRIREDARARSAELVEAVKAGTVFAHDQKQYGKWRAAVDRESRARPAKGLEQLRADFGGNVERGGFEFRN
jgi:hypothetical protein